MNYLAHFLLASQSPPSKRAGYYCGALLGDFIKGPLSSSNTIALFNDDRFPTATLDGIALHRHIDANFDNQAIVQSVRSRQPQNLRRFGGILIDLCCDNLLANHWAKYSVHGLEEFEDHVLNDLLPPSRLYPERACRLLHAFKQHSIISRYDEKEILEQTLSRIAVRLSAPALAEEFDALWQTKALLEPDFTELMHEMQNISALFIERRDDQSVADE